MRLLRQFFAFFVLALLALPALYGLIALALGILPAPHREPLPDQPTLPVYLLSNGWHVWLALPARHGDTDWAAWLPPGQAGPNWPAGAEDYVAFGWGDRDFYLATRRPVDFRPDLALGALLGRGPAAMHVMPLKQPEAVSDQVRRLDIDPLQYHALVAYIRGGFARGPDDRPQPIPGAAFGPHDAFYEATGRYSPFRTCNEWIGAGLRAAGLRAGWWTPFPFGLMSQP